MLCNIPCVCQIQKHILAAEVTAPPNQSTNKNLYKTEYNFGGDVRYTGQECLLTSSEKCSNTALQQVLQCAACCVIYSLFYASECSNTESPNRCPTLFILHITTAHELYQLHISRFIIHSHSVVSISALCNIAVDNTS